MPKQIHKITTFHGGINNNSDPRDILDEQFEKADNVSLNNLGKIVMGDAEADADIISLATPNVAMSHGAEVIVFNNSYSGMHDGDGSPLVSESTDYVAIGDNADAGIYIFEYSTAGTAINDWSNTDIIDIGTENDMDASFYYVDGVLRMSDSNLHSNSSTGWMGPAKREMWKATTSHEASNAASYTANSWFFSASAEPAGPTPGTNSFDSRYNSSGWGANTDVNYPINGSFTKAYDAVHICMRNTTSHGKGSGWTDGTTAYNFAVAVSFTYDGNQESPLVPITDASGNQFITPVAGNDAPNANVACRMRCFTYDGGALSTPADKWNPRITHINVYLKQEDVDTNFYLAAIFDTTLGGISVSEEASDATEGSSGSVNTNTWWAYKNFATNLYDVAHADSASRYSEVHMPFPPKFITHSEYSGIIGSHLSRNVLFKTAVVANRRVYLGNVSYKNDQRVQVVKEDAIIYSNINAFDTFALSEDGGNFLETNINDGDSIVKLLEFNDRLVEFKQNKVTIINIANPLPFIEQSLQHNGIKQKAAAFRTDFGVVWANEQACWLYDGEKVRNLLERDGVTLISQSNWSSFIQNPAAFYVPKTKQIGIVGDTTATNGHIYLNDLLTQSWTYHPDAQGSSLVSSIVINRNNKPMWYNDSVSSGIFKVWDAGTPTATAIKLHTKDIDFGQPSVRKKVYKVYVSYKGDGSAVSILYGINGETDTVTDLLPFYKTTADGSSDGTTSDTTPLLDDNSKEHWINAELKPVASINNIYSIQLFFDGTAGTDFEINDISIVYRMKSIK